MSRTTEDDKTAAERDQRDRQLDQARRMTDAEAAEFGARVDAWDARQKRR